MRTGNVGVNADSRPSIAVIGAGMGGLAVAALLHRAGIDVRIYEQARSFERIGSGIQMSPNAVRVLRGLGLGDRVREVAFEPRHWLNRDYDTGAMTNELALGATAKARYGEPYLLMHRGDLHALLASAVPSHLVTREKKLTSYTQDGSGVSLTFADGTTARADAMIAADGVHSLVRETAFPDEEPPRYSGRIAYRTTFPAHLFGESIDDCTKWWGTDRHIVIYYVTSARDEIYFTTSTPEPESTLESWSLEGDMDVLRAAYADFHPTVRAILAVCPRVNKWAIYERNPLRRWAAGRTVLLGDSCHPMTPYMAQGAASAMEDAVVLSRCLDGAGRDNLADAFLRFEETRKTRTSQLQATSHQNTFMYRATDPGWVYDYNAWDTPLADLTHSGVPTR